MTASTRERLTNTKGLFPSLGTVGVATNTLILAGTLVSLNASGYAVVPADGDGFNVFGVAVATADNRTTSPDGGANGAIDVDVYFGTYEFVYTGTAPSPGKVLYVVDNQTVSLDSDSGARGIAGYCTDVNTTTSKAYVLVGPTVAGQIVIAATEASQLDTAQADIVELQTDALSAQCFVPLPITMWRDNGGPLAAFVNGSVNGTELTDSEALVFRANPVGEDTTVLSTCVPLPPDLDDAEDIVLHIMAGRIGAADTTAVITCGAFFQTSGAAYDADSDAIAANTAALAAATKVLTEYTATIAAADVPAAPCAVTLTMAFSAALDADDGIISAAWLEYTRKLRTS